MYVNHTVFEGWRSFSWQGNIPCVPKKQTQKQTCHWKIPVSRLSVFHCQVKLRFKSVPLSSLWSPLRGRASFWPLHPRMFSIPCYLSGCCASLDTHWSGSFSTGPSHHVLLRSRAGFTLLLCSLMPGMAPHIQQALGTYGWVSRKVGFYQGIEHTKSISLALFSVGLHPSSFLEFWQYLPSHEGSLVLQC